MLKKLLILLLSLMYEKSLPAMMQNDNSVLWHTTCLSSLSYMKNTILENSDETHDTDDIISFYKKILPYFSILKNLSLINKRFYSSYSVILKNNHKEIIYDLKKSSYLMDLSYAVSLSDDMCKELVTSYLDVFTKNTKICQFLAPFLLEKESFYFKTFSILLEFYLSNKENVFNKYTFETNSLADAKYAFFIKMINDAFLIYPSGFTTACLNPYVKKVSVENISIMQYKRRRTGELMYSIERKGI